MRVDLQSGVHSLALGGLGDVSGLALDPVGRTPGRVFCTRTTSGDIIEADILAGSFRVVLGGLTSPAGLAANGIAPGDIAAVILVSDPGIGEIRRIQAAGTPIDSQPIQSIDPTLDEVTLAGALACKRSSWTMSCANEID